MATESTKVYFPNLNSLRFLLAIFVVFFHIHRLIYIHDGETFNAETDHELSLAELVVSAFFVLSGFLITYLLLKERNDTGHINIKEFYIRRVLRIWPLYYLILILGFFVFPYLDTCFNTSYSSGVHNQFGLNLASSIFFLQPYMIGLNHIPQTLAPIWSIKVEEFFYLFWPLLLIRAKDHLKLFVYIIIGYITLKLGISIVALIFKPAPLITQYSILAAMRQIIMNYRISCLAIGGVGAYLVIDKKQNILSFIFRKDVQWLAYISALLLLLLNVSIPIIDQEFYSVLFGIIIINLGCNPGSVVNLEYKWISYLGKAAYGIYMYNAFTRVICFEFIERIYGHAIMGWQMESLLFVSGLSLTILVSVLSYELLEKPFLKLKKRFTVVKTD